MTNVSAVEKIAELMQQMEASSPRVAALHYCLSEVAKRITELEQKLAVSQREFRAADATIENLQMQLEKLAAENAGLKSKAAELVHEASEVYSAYNSTITEPDGDFMDMQTLQEMQCVETQATDAFLAEVRASGIDAWIESLGDKWNGTTKDAERFAEHLRKGVQS